jgi:hypothetical protein
MIESDVIEIINEPNGQGERLGLLADQFRLGRDIVDLLTLLDSNNVQVVRIGAWIAGEITVDAARAQPLVARLRLLAGHSDASIRFHASGALFSYLDPTDPATKEFWARLSRDPVEGIRIAAEAALRRIERKRAEGTP